MVISFWVIQDSDACLNHVNYRSASGCSQKIKLSF
jgi:hypothetical protein